MNAEPLRVWLVDDDASIRWVLERALRNGGMLPKSFDAAEGALAALRSEAAPDVLITDIRMPGQSGLELVKRIRGSRPQLPVIVMTAHADLDSAVSAYESGAFEYLPKPFDIDQAVDLVRRAATTTARAANDAAVPPSIPELLGRAPAMQQVFRAIGRLSRSSVTVLITGESGTGKELVARALHEHSPRSGKPFIALNTSAIPAELLESELFGHEKGAFTGADALRRGRFEQADGGTLFLDEIGDMPFDLQTRLLRVLSDGSFYRVGGHSAVKSNVRVIAATHQDLEQRVKEGSFREDLFHRLNVIRLRLPRLTDRREDIPMLTRHFLQQSARQLGVEPKRISDAAVARLGQFHFPGNVRQLENICHWLTVMAPAQVIELKDLPPEVLGSAPAPAAVASAAMQVSATTEPAVVADPQAVAGDPAPAMQTPVSAVTADLTGAGEVWEHALEREAHDLLAAGREDVWDVLTRRFETSLIQAALGCTRGRRIEAAQKLGIGRNTITRKIQELGLE